MVRLKNRYIVMEINPEKPTKDDSLTISPYTLQGAILKKIQQLHGDFGTAATTTGFIAKYCNEKTRIALVKVRHGPHKLVGSALPCINKVDNKRVSLNTLYTGATIRQCFKFILNYQQKKLDQMCATFRSDEEKNASREALLNFDSILGIG